jgi:NADH dehydrogenase
METRANQHRVVVIGGGFGGLATVRGLRDADADVLLVDRVNHHLFQPLLYQVATALLPPGDIAPALRAVLRDQKNARVLLGEVTGVDAQAREVKVALPDGSFRLVGYDTLVVAAGSTDSYFGHDEWQKVAPPMKSLAHAVHLRSQLLRAFEVAAVTEDPEERRRWLTFAIVGAGPTGVELAGQIADMTRRTLRGQFRDLDPTQVRIVLLDAAPSVLPPFDEPTRAHTRRSLERLGVEVRLDEMVADISEDGVVTKPMQAGDDAPSRHVPARNVIWAAGVKAAPLAAELARATGVETDRKGRIVVRPNCTLPGHPEIFAVGDMINLNDLPGMAEPALQEGHYVAKVIRARLAGRYAPKRFRYLNLGSMATISPSDAVADIGKLHLRGTIGKIAWALVHIAFLVEWRNRIAVLVEWFWFLATGRRAQRIILEPVHHPGSVEGDTRASA